MIDIHALKARLSDPREVARLLGLRVEQKLGNGVLCRCPVHNNKSGALRLQVKGGALKMNCFGCGIYGDAIDLIVAMEGDYRRGLERAASLVGGSVAVPVPVYAEPDRCDPDVYHELATRVLDAGCLDRREWTMPVQDYLGKRGLLELARENGWAALPPLKWLQGLADREALVKAKLARWTDRGEFVATWPAHRLVIPWRGPDGRINALQRRRVTDGDGPKYVLPWAPEWPYGSESIPAGNHYLRVSIVEGAVDTLAMRALYPSFAALGIPGINGWRASWASLAAGRELRIALDWGKPDPNGIVQEDRAAARIALDCAGRGQETDRVLEWWLSRWRRGRALGCVLCGAGEAWLCGGCGRRRAPAGLDWGGIWQRRSAR